MLWAAAGHSVRFVSLTNGDAGHHVMAREELAARRAAEARAACAAGGLEGYEVLGTHDGALRPTLELREELIRLIRCATCCYLH